jgi:glycosyltransferase involved in cell wall biosynthesis
MQTVLFVSHDASRTGAPIFLLRLLQWLQRYSRISFRTLSVIPGEMLPQFESLGPVDVLERDSKLRRVCRRFNLLSFDDSQHLLSLRRKLSACNIGLIYANTSAIGRTLDYLSFLDCPVICHVHELEGVIQQCNRNNNLTLLKRHATFYLAVSHAVKHNLLRHGIREDQVDVIPGFIPTNQSTMEHARKSSAAVRRELRIPGDAPLVCACGTLEPRKGPDLFLDVACDLAKVSGELRPHFVWIGGNKVRVEAMRRRVRELHREDNVHFIGMRPDVGPYYSAADVFLLPSREDPFPLVMLEAALREKPILCFANAGGAPEFVQHDAGFVVPGFAVDAMSEKLSLLLGSEDLRRRMGQTGRQRVLRHHDIDTCAPRIAAIIQNALTGPKGINVRSGTAWASR